MVHHKLLRLAATLVFVGEVLLGVAQFLHPGGGNTYEATFADYAASGNWVVIHLGQFVGMAVALAGLIVLFFALGVSQGTPRRVGLFGAIAAGMALVLYGVFEAVDGVALKQAVNAWASAPAAEKAARFASAEAIR
jgi:hypothetical protein